jgi:hypothetical protein
VGTCSTGCRGNKAGQWPTAAEFFVRYAHLGESQARDAVDFKEMFR